MILSSRCLWSTSKNGGRESIIIIRKQNVFRIREITGEPTFCIHDTCMTDVVVVVATAAAAAAISTQDYMFPWEKIDRLPIWDQVKFAPTLMRLSKIGAYVVRSVHKTGLICDKLWRAARFSSDYCLAQSHRHRPCRSYWTTPWVLVNFSWRPLWPRLPAPIRRDSETLIDLYSFSRRSISYRTAGLNIRLDNGHWPLIANAAILWSWAPRWLYVPSSPPFYVVAPQPACASPP